MSRILTYVCAVLLTTAAAATIGYDKIDNNLAECVRAFSRAHKSMRTAELFSCESSMSEHLHIAKILMPEGLHCNVNLIDASGNIEMRLSSIKSEQRERQTMMIVDTSCTSGGNLLQLASQLEMFNGHYRWILVVRASTQQHASIIELLSVLNISISSEITLFRTRQRQRPLLLLLYDIWNPSHSHGGRLVVTAMGNCTAANGMQLSDDFRAAAIKRRTNMQQIMLKVMFVVGEEMREPLEVVLHGRRDPLKHSMTRFSFALLEIIREMFNLTYTLKHSKSWGYLQDDGTFDGMIGALVRGDVDVAGTSMLPRAERHEVISFTAESWTHRTCFIFQQPTKSALKNPFFRPFVRDVWIILGIFGLASALAPNLVGFLHKGGEELPFECDSILRI